MFYDTIYLHVGKFILTNLSARVFIDNFEISPLLDEIYWGENYPSEI